MPTFNNLVHITEFSIGLKKATKLVVKVNLAQVFMLEEMRCSSRFCV